MSQYEQLKTKCDNLIKESLNSNKNILIESFVEYYGEKYRSVIKKKFNEISFVYYINWKFMDSNVKDYIQHVENPNKYADFVNLFNSKKKRRSIFTDFFNTLNEKRHLLDKLIGSTNPSIFNIPYISYDLFTVFNSHNAACRCYYDDKMNVNRVIFFEILAHPESVIIHEINHAITRDTLAYVYKGKEIKREIYKSGLYLNSDKKDKIVDELINEKAAQEITNIFKQKGGDFSLFCLNVPTLFYPYNMNLYLIDEFYDTFKEYIKTARISENKNALIERIGKTNYERFVHQVNLRYSEKSSYLSIIDQIKEINLSKIKPIIEEMKKKAKNSHEMSQQELDEYYEYLKNQGFRVKILNDKSDDINELSLDTEDNVKRR